MKAITINGVEYLPATALAKQFKYTTDYIGQLCRANKVDAQLVGRSWYVNPDSLFAHKKSRYTKISVSENSPEEYNEIKISRLDVEPVTSKNSVKMIHAASKNFTTRIDWKPVRYETDESSLLPEMQQELSTKKLQVGLAGGTDLAIKNLSNPTLMVAEPLPEVSLRGDLHVNSIDDQFEEEFEESEVTEEDIPEEAPVFVKKVDESDIKMPTIKHTNRFEERLAAKSLKKDNKSTFTPVSVMDKLEVETKEPALLQLSLLSSAALLFVCLLLVLLSEVKIEANSVSYHYGMEFSTESLTALASHFLTK